MRARFVRYVHGHVGAANLAISDFRVFGNADGRAPSRPSGARRAQRHKDQRDATIRWAKVPGAVGYNIRFGIRPDRLTLTHQLWADELGDGGDADEGASVAERRRALLGGCRGVQRDRRFEAQPRCRCADQPSQPPVNPARFRPSRIAGTCRMYRQTNSSR